MLVRKLQAFRSQYMINLPAEIVKSFDWKKGDLIKIEIPAKGVIQLSKVEIMRIKMEDEKTPEKELGIHQNIVKPPKIPYVKDERSDKPSDKIKFFK